MSNVILGGEMLAPGQESKFKRREGLEIPDEGPSEFLCVGVIELGTHEETYENKTKNQKKIMIIWEKCDLKQLIYEEDTEPRSYIKYDEVTFFMNSKSRLFKLAKATFGKDHTEDDLLKNKVNLLGMLGRRTFLMLEHKESKNGEIYPKITGYSICKKAPDEDFISDGNQYGWYLDKDRKNFSHPAFAALPKWIRDKIKESQEGKDYAEEGGKFAEPEETTSSSSSEPKPPTDVDVPKGWTFEDSKDGFSYSSYIASGWTNNQLAKKGYLKKVEEAPKPSAPEPKEEAPKPSAPNPVSEEEDSGYNPFDDEDDDLPF